MQWKNTPNRFGVSSIVLHWLSALAVFGLFALGYWMVGLSYYDPWRQTAPDWHKSVGVLLLLATLLRVLWRVISPPPAPLASYSKMTRIGAAAGHGLLYLGLFVVMISGYLISTADGRSIDVFGWFSLPATLTGLPSQEDVAGVVHKYVAWGLVIFAGLHGLVAIKHHVFDRDRTLLRMFGR